MAEDAESIAHQANPGIWIDSTRLASFPALLPNLLWSHTVLVILGIGLIKAQMFCLQNSVAK